MDKYRSQTKNCCHIREKRIATIMLPEKSIFVCSVLIAPMMLYYLLLFIIIYIWDGEMVPCSLIFILQVLSLKMYRVKTVQL